MIVGEAGPSVWTFSPDKLRDWCRKIKPASEILREVAAQAERILTARLPAR